MAIAREPAKCVHHNNCQCVRVISPWGFTSAIGLDTEVGNYPGDKITLESSRDSHLPPEQRPRLVYDRDEWELFIEDVKAGNFDLP